MDISSVYPLLDAYVVRPMLVKPPMCQLKELKDGTYSLYDIEYMHQILDVREYTPPEAEGLGG